MKRLLVLLLIITMMVSNLLIPRNVYASTETLTVSGEGDQTQGIYFGAPATFVNLQSDDDAVSYLYLANTAWVSGDYHCLDMTNTTHTVINSVTLYAKFYEQNYGVAQLYNRQSGTNYIDTTTYTSDATWTLHSKTWSTNPKTGVAWTMAEVNATQFGILQQNTFGGAPTPVVNITYMYVVVDYTLQAPTSTTVAASSILNTSATLNGTLDNTGGATITNYGFVWDTVSRADPGNTAPTASAYAASWEAGVGTYSLGAVLHSTGATLVANTTYYFRVAATNSVGWAYGTELSFKTVGIPSGTTDIATMVATVTARINASVTNDNGQLCDVRFGWDVHTHATVAAYANQTAWVNDTYATGSFPYVDLTGLAVGTQYFFRVEIQNDAGAVEGAEQTFTTGAAIGAPTSFKAIPTATTISLSWVKGTYSAYTLIRYSTGTYPATTADGTLAYLDTNNSISVAGLTEGTTYYFTAWGKTSTFYSAAGTNLISTTSGYTPALITPPTSPTNTSFTRDPSTAKVAAIPVIGTMVANVATSYAIPDAMLWYFLWIITASFIGIVVYNITGVLGGGSKNLNVALFAALGFVGIGIVMELVMLWVLFFMIIVGLGWILVGERR